MHGNPCRCGGNMERKRKSKKKKWIHFRHRVVRNLAFLVLYPYSRIKYGIKPRRFKEQEDRPYLVLLNHQTPFDQFFVGMSFRGHLYYMATEDLFSKGWISSLIRYLVAPIPIKKQTADASAILNCLRVAKEGGSIAIAPEGNRTYSGRTEYMSPSIVLLARKLKLPIVLYRIVGGYGKQPRWSDVVRRGKMESYVSRVINPEEYEQMTDNELFDAISQELFVDESTVSGSFPHKKSAEYLERAMYVCPYCGLSEFESHGRIVKCKKCSRQIEYLPTKELLGVGFDFPFRFVADWYDYQKDFINELDVTLKTEEPIYLDSASLWKIIPCKNRERICKEAKLSLYGDRVSIEGIDCDICYLFPFDKVSAVTVLGRNKLNIYCGEDILQIKGGKRFNALKYVHIYHRYKNIRKGEPYAEFLGL